MNDQIPKWTKEAADECSKFKDWTDFIQSTKEFSQTDKKELISALKDAPFPKVVQKDPFTLSIDGVELKIVSLISGDFKFNGQAVNVPSGATQKHIFKLMKRAYENKSGFIMPHFLFLPDAYARSGEGTNIDRELVDLDFIYSRDFTRPMDHEDSWALLAIPTAGIPMMAVYLADKFITQSGITLGEKCERQQQIIPALLRERNMAFASFNCGSWRGNDRSFTIWTRGPNGKPKKRYFVFDLRAGILQENIYIKKPSVVRKEREAKEKERREELAAEAEQKALLDRIEKLENQLNKKKKGKTNPTKIEAALPKVKQIEKASTTNEEEDIEDEQDIEIGKYDVRKVAYFFTVLWNSRGDNHASKGHLGADEPLYEVRTLEPAGRPNRKQIFRFDDPNEVNKAQFAKFEKDIEPLREVLYYMGKNAFCEKCEICTFHCKSVIDTILKTDIPKFLSDSGNDRLPVPFVEPPPAIK